MAENGKLEGVRGLDIWGYLAPPERMGFQRRTSGYSVPACQGAGKGPQPKTCHGKLGLTGPLAGARVEVPAGVGAQGRGPSAGQRGHQRASVCVQGAMLTTLSRRGMAGAGWALLSGHLEAKPGAPP